MKSPINGARHVVGFRRRLATNHLGREVEPRAGGGEGSSLREPLGHVEVQEPQVFEAHLGGKDL